MAFSWRIAALALAAALLAPRSADAQGGGTPAVTVNNGHSVLRLVFAAGDRRAATGGDDQSIKLWDIESGRLLRTMPPLSKFPVALAISPDGSRIAAGDTDGEVRIWESETGRLIATKPAAQLTRGTMIFSQDGRSLLLRHSVPKKTFGIELSETMVARWDIASGSVAKAYLTVPDASGWRPSIGGDALAVTRNEKLIAGGELSKGFVSLWDATSGRILRRWSAYAAGVSRLAMSADGARIVTVGYDSKEPVKVWEAATGRLLREFPTHGIAVTDMVLSRDGETLYLLGNDAVLRAARPATGALLWSTKLENGGLTLAETSDGRFVGVGNDGIDLYDRSSGVLTRSFRPAAHQQYGTTALALPDGNWLIGDGQGYGVWDAATSERRRRFAEGDGWRMSRLARTSDGRMLVGSQNAWEVKLWDFASGALVSTVSITPVAGSGLASSDLSPDGRLVAAALYGKAGGGLIRFLDSRTGAAKGAIRAYDEFILFARFSPDGRQIVSAGYDGAKNDTASIKVWDVETGRLASSSPLNSARGARFAPDARTVFGMGSDGDHLSVRQFATGDGKEVHAFRHGFAVDQFEVSPDGRFAASSGGLEAQVKLWDIATGRLLFALKNDGRAAGLGFSSDGGRLVVVNAGGTHTLWNTRTGDLITTTAKSEAGEWVTITPEGFFTASEKGADLLHVVQGFEVTGIDQVYQALYRPDLVREKLAGDPKGLVREAAAKLDLSKVMASGMAPKVTIIGPAAGARQESEEVLVEAELADRGGGIGRVEWRVNGLTLGVEERGLARVDAPAAGPGRPAVKVSRKLALEPGENVVEVVAYNGRNLIASEPARVRIAWDGADSSAPPVLHVVAVGVNDYWDSRLRLSYAVPDAKALGEAMKAAGGGLYRSVEVTTALDAEVSAENLDRLFAELGRKVRPRDVFVFFLAGHGKTVDGRYYFLPRDFRYEGEESIVKGGIDQDRFQSWFARIAARKSILLYDTCESGSLTGERVAQRGIERVAALERMTRAMGRTVLSASTDDAPALEGYKGHGVFTYALLEGIGGADLDGNGTIEVTELAGYVDRTVPELSFAAFKQRQIPQMRIVGSNFPLATRTAALAGEGTGPAAGGSAAAGAAAPAKPTHVVIMPAAARPSPDPSGAAVVELPPGSQVVVLATEAGWAVVARDGKRIGFVEERALARLQ